MKYLLPFFLSVSVLLAANRTITFGWDGVRDVDGYALYFGPNHLGYTNRVFTTETNLSVSLPADTTFFVAVASVSEGIESDFSKEFVYSFPTLENTNFVVRIRTIPSEGTAEISFQVQPYSTAEIQCSTDCLVWFPLSVIQTATGLVTLTDSAGSDSRFYRVRVL